MKPQARELQYRTSASSGRWWQRTRYNVLIFASPSLWHPTSQRVCLARCTRVARRAGSCDCRGRAAHWQLRDVRARARPAPPPADQFSLESLRPFLSEDFPGAASSRLCRWTGPVAALPSRDERHTLLACCTRWEINSSGVIRLVTLRSAFRILTARQTPHLKEE